MTLLPSVRSMCHHGQSHVHCRERRKEMQEVHQGQAWVLLDQGQFGEQGEGTSEGICTEATCPSSQNQDDSPQKAYPKSW